MRQSSAGSSRLRQRTEDYQRASLSSWATLATDTKGRESAEDPDPLRTAFQRDCDRVRGSDSFRRLADKSQSFLGQPDPLGSPRDRSRADHALQVASVARTIARALGLNEDLVEAVALGLDLGHTPFAQAGEEALAVFTDVPFRHHEQSLRVVDVLERDGAGLNLTWEVRDGILHHPWTMPPPATPEGQAVRLANRLVRVTGDIDDALRGGVVRLDEVPREVVAALGGTPGQRIATLVADAVEASLDRPEVRSGPRVDDAVGVLDRFLAERVHARPAARAQADRAVHVMRSLAVLLLEHPSELTGPGLAGDPLEVRVLDAVSGMTDARALAEFHARFSPDPLTG